MEEVELILAEMCNPFGDPNQRLLAVSPMPPSPVPMLRKKKKKKDKSDRARKRLVHQNSIGFEPSVVSPRAIMPSSPVFTTPPESSRLKAEVTHNPDVGYEFSSSAPLFLQQLQILLNVLRRETSVGMCSRLTAATLSLFQLDNIQLPNAHLRHFEAFSRV